MYAENKDFYNAKSWFEKAAQTGFLKAESALKELEEMMRTGKNNMGIK
jgi:TPR repeat protein